MTAREKFVKGEAVEYSAKWLSGGPSRRQRQLTVVGFGHRAHLVRVVVDGLRTPFTMHMDFVERRQSGEAG